MYQVFLKISRMYESFVLLNKDKKLAIISVVKTKDQTLEFAGNIILSPGMTYTKYKDAVIIHDVNI